MERMKKERKRNWRQWGILLTVMSGVLFGCSMKNDPEKNSAANNSHDRLQIVATFYPVYEFAAQVAGDAGQVQLLLSAGQDSHQFEPSPKDMAAIYDADVFIYSSKYMETWVPAVLETLEESDVKIIEAAEKVPFYEADHGEEEQGENHSGHQHTVDPHVWLDPTYAELMVQTIMDGLKELDQERATEYEANTNAYRLELQQLDQEYQDAFAQAEHRTFVVQHAAFGYLARRYDLQEVSLSTLTSDQEVSPAKMAEIGAFIQKQHIKALYYQDSASSKTAETLAEETDTELLKLSSIEGISDQDLKEGADYLSVMRQNLEALKKTIQ